VHILKKPILPSVYTHGTIQTMISLLLDFLFPRFCIGCGTPHTQLCTSCIYKLPRARSPKHIDIAVFDYRNKLVRSIIWHLKYRHKYPLATHLGNTMYEILLEELSEYMLFDTQAALYVIPIPLSRKRARHRGYNQSACIARALCANSPDMFIYTPHALYRHKNTPPQTHIRNKTKRKENIKGCFSVPYPEEVRGKDILLIDDVSTTGATLLEARKTLKKAGARSVLCVAAAH